ncbi:MAG: type VI secretion protein [Rhizobiales bacterium 65-79]|jgi:type VI secretion system protein ImpH|nr:type VI secretion system baseplate subunit TssG [Hyphomicrobiales bacterium]OJU02210.1 MAG: type VI secretion protein [Rhizobiales bacterium 65-79]
MADDARQSLPDLSEATTLSEAFDFFELLRRLERDGRLFGHSGRATREPARLDQHVRMSFSPRDVVQFSPEAAGKPARVAIANFGLLGPEGPMPLHVTRWVMDRLSQRWFAGQEAKETSDTTFVDFVNVLQHRLTALFYRAWADATPAVQVERAEGDRLLAMLRSMAGIGLPGTRDGRSVELDRVKVRQAASLAIQRDGPEKLTQFLSEAFGVPVRLKEFIAAWISVPRPLQTRLCMAHARLHREASIGPRTFSRQSRIEIRVGPLDLRTYLTFLPGSRRLRLFTHAVRDLIGEGLDVDLRVVLARPEIPRARIGKAQLGRTAWLAPTKRGADAEDFRLRTIVGWRLDQPRGAA